MTGRDGTKGNNRRRMSIVGGAVGAFAAAAAMATGSAVTAAPAKADIDALLDPIIQPIITSLSDAIVGFDPAAAADLTTWTDSLLASLNSLDIGAALPASADPAAALPAADASSTYEIPITMEEGTEPTVQATIDGTSNAVLVDTGSSGLVIPWEALGSNDFSALENLFTLGLPSSFGESGYSGGVQYLYLTYDNIPVNYGDGLDTSNTPTDVVIFSWPTSISAGSPDSFEAFLADNDSPGGILGIGPNTGGPGTSPFVDDGSVTIDIKSAAGGDLIVGGDNPFSGITTLTGAPTSAAWVSVDGAAPQEVTDDVDSGGATGALPQSLFTTSEYNSTTDLVNPGTKISVYSNQAETDLLYSYTVTADNDPYVVSGNGMDSGIEPYLLGPIYMSYLPTGTGTTIFDYSPTP
jgi:hypothetical protein